MSCYSGTEAFIYSMAVRARTGAPGENVDVVPLRPAVHRWRRGALLLRVMGGGLRLADTRAHISAVVLRDASWNMGGLPGSTASVRDSRENTDACSASAK